MIGNALRTKALYAVMRAASPTAVIDTKNVTANVDNGAVCNGNDKVQQWSSVT